MEAVRRHRRPCWPTTAIIRSAWTTSPSKSDPITIAQRDGTLKRNFQGYTTDGADVLIGFGASSIGAMRRVCPEQPGDRAIWRSRPRRPVPIVKGKQLSADDRMRRDLIERLMCDLAVDLDEVACAMA